MCLLRNLLPIPSRQLWLWFFVVIWGGGGNAGCGVFCLFVVYFFLNLIFIFLIWIVPPLCPSDCLYFVQSVVLQESDSGRLVQTATFQP